MAIFWGGGSKSKNYDGLWVPYFCSSCSKLSPFSVTENYKYGQVYGIRIAKFKSKYFLVCPTCDRVIVIENKEKFMSAQRIARHIKTQDLEKMDINIFVIEVAREVLNNYEIATELEKIINNDGKKITKKSAKTKVIDKTKELDNVKICPECAETVKFAAKKCRFCNYVFG
jgi:ribosomal protein L40E